MTRIQDKFYRTILFFGDTVLFLFSVYFAYALRNQTFTASSQDLVLLSVAFLPIFIVLTLSYFIASLYEVPSPFTNLTQVKMILRLHVFALVFGLIVFYTFPLFDITPKTILLLQSFIFIILQVFFRVYFSYHVASTKKRRAILIGEGQVYTELKEAVNGNPQSSITFVDHIEINSPLLVGNSLDAFTEILKKNAISCLVVDVKSEKVIPILPYLYNLVGDGLRIYDIHKMYEDVFRRMPLSSIGYFWFFENVTLDMRIYEMVKRCMDIVIAVFVALIWLPLHPIVAFLIKREDGGAVFLHNQLRIGRYGKPIRLVKYRTMSQDDSGVWLKEKGNTNKVTKIGYILRKSRIDELPQVINVLRGELSLVGPRPDVVDIGNKMASETPFYMIRYSVKPGLSGWAQTLQDKPPQTVEETKLRLMYDLFYIKNRSVLVDTIILLRTIRTLLIRSGM